MTQPAGSGCFFAR